MYALRGQKRASDPLELKLQALVCHVQLGNRTPSSGKAAGASDCPASPHLTTAVSTLNLWVNPPTSYLVNYVSGWLACIFVCAPCECLMPMGTKRWHQIPWNWNYSHSEPLCGYWESNPGPLGEQPMLWTTEWSLWCPSPTLVNFCFLFFCFLFCFFVFCFLFFSRQDFSV